MIARLAILGMLVVATSSIPGCGKPAAGPPRLRLAAASDLTRALPIVASAFRLRSGIEIEATYGASGLLAEQIRQGAPFDVFLSADRRFVGRLAEEKVVRADSVRPYARGSLALVLPSKAGPEVKGLADLAGPSVKHVAIANPETAPYGRAAKQALERAGIYATVEAKLVPAGSVSQALQLVQSGNADVGIVGRSAADAPGVKVIPLPADACDPIVQYLGIVAGSDRSGDATAFVEFLLSEDGQKMLTDLGFERAAEGPAATGRGTLAR